MVKNAEDVRYFKSPVYVNVLGKRQKRYQAALTFAPDGKEAMSMADMRWLGLHMRCRAQVLGGYKKGAEFRKFLLRRDKNNELLGALRALQDVTKGS